MNAAAIPSIKQTLRNLHSDEARRLANQALNMENAAQVRGLYQAKGN
jgi:phosphoenolpyruvate-protein kinase (PTS system EI component)